MRVLLINPPKEEEFALFVLEDYSTKARSNQHPLGLLYLHAYLRNDHTVKIFDMNALELSVSDINNEIDTFQPDIIGISCVIGKVLTVRALCKQIKQPSQNIPIVLGGQNPSLYPWESLQDKNVDYIVSGFGQIPLKELCDRLENNKDIHNIKNVHTRINCTEKIKGTFEFVNLDEFPIPDRSILPIEDYQMPFAPENPCTSMVTSLGCPFRCNFCASKNYKPVTLRKPENIVAEMKNIESLKIRSIMFQDELFTLSTKIITNICSLIISEGVNINWAVRSRANLVNDEALALMKEAGCWNIHFGIESGTDRILGEMNKGLTIDTIKKSVSMVKDVGLSVSASFMIGYLSETESEILETIQFAKSLELDVAQFYIVQPEPCTELYSQVKEMNNLPDDIYSEFVLNGDEIILKNNIASNIFSKEQLEDFLKFAYSQTKTLYNVKND